MSVELSPEVEQIISSKIASGRYTSAEDVVREGLRLMEERDRRMLDARAQIREQIEIGYESVLRGDLIDGRQFFDDLERAEREIERNRG